MAQKILAVSFWVVGALLQTYAVVTGGWAWAVPGAAVVAALLVALDLGAHRRLVALDWALARTLLHVFAAVTVAASCMYWLAALIVTRGRGL